MGEAATSARRESVGEPGEALWTVHHDDARNLGKLLERVAMASDAPGAPFVKTTITSPPYATLVDYGSEGQIGFGQTYEDYLSSCRDVFRDVHSWTVDDGSMWVVADSMLEGKAVKDSPSRLVPIPFDLAAQAEAVGWTLREVVIWRKDRTRPWSHKGKLRNGFEYVLFFAKTKRFYFNADRLRETGTLKSWWVKYPERHNPWGMTPDNVWEIPIPIQGSWDSSAVRHACPFPAELVRRMVLLSTNEGDVVLDPFAGTGTVVSGARAEGRLGLGVEINDEYIEAFKATPERELRKGRAPEPVSSMTQRLLELRMLKYPKDLAKQILRSGITADQIPFIFLEVQEINYKPARSGYGDIVCTVSVSSDTSELEIARLAKVISEATSRPPLSKYGLKVTVEVALVDSLLERISDEDVSLYTKGRTWFADSIVSGNELDAWLADNVDADTVPIVSSLHVRQSLEE